MKTTTRFDKGQVRLFVKRVKDEASCGWSMLGERIQTALIAERALLVLAGQVSATVPTDELLALRNAMLVEAGLLEAQS